MLFYSLHSVTIFLEFKLQCGIAIFPQGRNSINGSYTHGTTIQHRHLTGLII